MSKDVMARAQALNPDHSLDLRSYDHDHFILQNDAAMRDMVGFFRSHLSDCEAG